MISKAMIKFRLSFSFKFVNNFKGRLKKFKLVMVMVKRSDNYQHSLNLPKWLPFCFFMIQIEAY